jgi:DNA replication protein DnaC
MVLNPATKLVNELVEAADDKLLTKTIARYGRVDLLCIDELGYMELDRRGAELLFQVLTERRRRTAWPSPLTSPSPKRTGSRQRVQGDAKASRVGVVALANGDHWPSGSPATTPH